MAWNERNYTEHGFGLWVIELADGTFVGGCGLMMQDVEGEGLVEVGYHVGTAWQGRGLATEAAGAGRDAARDAGIPHLVAIIRPSNRPSQRVAEKIGLRLERRIVKSGDALVFSADLQTVP
ncbi:GNAT family N-acetyltransferase [Leekyejoonella antrihumi]|uniref:GNAT family N-acetyltransferase n=1 Tax=Leekyejoonella antrihumi TaxID=1660198 RepID=A0A563DTH8_9MICO|nr:GNAT family N-acetyltransferase [Leekyejoonella antrihumi]TWP33557.1 GNAT family N-acetyltransferase [Leekyejoonella antrihumi]